MKDTNSEQRRTRKIETRFLGGNKEVTEIPEFQWLGLLPHTAGSTDLIPGQGSYAVWFTKNKLKKK